jgi:2-keto-4-pentenoate hydratase/2-oxohepta-3-ene-1,7-dioic acid hydratase in catechol pathway
MTFRLASVDERAVFVDEDQQYYDIEAVSGGELGPDPMDALADLSALHQWYGQLADVAPTGSLADVTVGPPVPRPRNSFGVGLNYLNHADESNMELPPNPLVFTKFPSCIVGPTADVELRSETADYEAELVVVMGTGGRDIDRADAWDRVAGLTIGQDISDRALQFAAKPPHFDLGKSRDTYGPIGPVLVSPDAVGNKDDLAISCDINDERRQDDTTAQLIFDVPALIAYLSAIITLGPGDLIFTGTPEGVGAARRLYLKPGDVITTTIEGIGTMTNRCR